MSFDLTANPLQANVIIDVGNDVIRYNYGFSGFVLNNGYIYIGCTKRSNVYCYNISTGNHTLIDGGSMFDYAHGAGIYNSYLYMADYYPPTIIT